MRLLPSNLQCACLLQGKGQACPALRSVLLVGNPSLPLKGFDVAINALAAINQVLPLHVTWVCQTQPNATLVPTLTGSGLCISLYINPSQVSRLWHWTCSEPDSCAAMSCVVPSQCLFMHGPVHQVLSGVNGWPKQRVAWVACWTACSAQRGIAVPVCPLILLHLCPACSDHAINPVFSGR